MSLLKVEFLASQDKKVTTCSDKKRIISALNSDSIFEVTEKEIKFLKTSFPFTIKELSAENVAYRCFQIVIESKKVDIEKFIKLKNFLERDLNKHFNDKVQVVWNEIDDHYSALAYPLIRKIENLMRKFLTQFFQMNVGAEWVKKSVPEIITSKAERNGIENTNNFLSSIDFIDINNFLFKEHTKYDIQVIFGKINKSKNPMTSMK